MSNSFTDRQRAQLRALGKLLDGFNLPADVVLRVAERLLTGDLQPGDVTFAINRTRDVVDVEPEQVRKHGHGAALFLDELVHNLRLIFTLYGLPWDCEAAAAGNSSRPEMQQAAGRDCGYSQDGPPGGSRSGEGD